MATDVVPELLSEIETAFKSHNLSDRTLARVSKRIRDGTATQIDGHAYAERLGKNASKALQDVLTEDNLPDGKLYYNIATRTVIPTLETNQALINDAAAEILKTEDVKSKLHLNAIKPKFPAERINGLIDKMTAEGIELEQALAWIREPIVNNSEAFFDDFVRENAKFRADAGLKTTISRVAESKACDWCQDLAGTYEYGYTPDEIYARHEFCRCVVTVTSRRSNTSQNVWSKREWQASKEEIERRVNTTPNQTSATERLEVLARRDKDKVVKQIMEVTGYDRKTANKMADEPYEKIQKKLAKARLRNTKRR